MRQGKKSKLLLNDNTALIFEALVSGAKGISKIRENTNIPIATLYRLLGKLESNGLIAEVKPEKTKYGRNESTYESKVKSFRFAYENGEFSLDINNGEYHQNFATTKLCRSS